MSSHASAAETHHLSALVDSLTAAAQTRDAPPATLAAAVRYVLTIQATDARGDACPIMDCSRRPTGPRR